MNPLPEEGTTSNRYTILGRLAGGGMADIFLTRVRTEAGVDRHVVLKRVLAERSNDQHFASMFLDEARLASQLHHPNIAQVYDIGKLAGSYFFTMEYVHGEDARHLLQRLAGLRRKLPVHHALHIATNSLLALHHAHERTTPSGKPLGIVHRDVTPSNLMIAYDGSVKLLDFGVAKAAERIVESRSGTIKGKIAYLSPEQCKGNKVDRRSDIYSLGIVLYEMLTTSRLYRRDTDFATMNAIVSEPVPVPSALNPEVSSDLDAIVLKALAKEPADRYPTAAAMVEALEAVAAAQRLVMSVSSMSRFMRELYGERPEPWVDLEHEPDSRAITITSEAITVGNDAFAAAKGIAEPGTLTFATLDTPARDEIEAQLQHAPTIGRVEGDNDASSPFANTPPPQTSATREQQTKPALTKTVDLRGPGETETSVDPLEATETLGTATVEQLAEPVTSITSATSPATPRVAVVAEQTASVARGSSGRAIALVAGGTAIVVVAIVIVIGFTGGNSVTPPARDGAVVAAAPDAAPPIDAAIATLASDAAVAPTIAAAVARADWSGALELCHATKSKLLGPDDRMSCGRAACNAKKRTIALAYYPLLAPPEQAALERECRGLGVALKAKDPCEANPLKCRKP